MTYRNDTTYRTSAQAAFLQKLVLSSVFTPAEAQRTRAWLATPKATRLAVSAQIDKAKLRIAARNAARKASEERRELYHAAKHAKAASEEASAARAFDNEQGPRPQPADILFH